jgi:prepilin-type processing-associated H-X9-DG protein
LWANNAVMAGASCCFRATSSSFHSTGCNYLFGDGAVRFVHDDIDAESWVSLFTCAAHDTILTMPQ